MSRPVNPGGRVYNDRPPEVPPPLNPPPLPLHALATWPPSQKRKKRSIVWRRSLVACLSPTLTRAPTAGIPHPRAARFVC